MAKFIDEKTFKCIYLKHGKHHRRCLHCGKLLKDRDQAVCEKGEKTGWTDIGGVWYRPRYGWFHAECHKETERQRMRDDSNYKSKIWEEL